MAAHKAKLAGSGGNGSAAGNWRLFFEAAPDAMVVIDRDGHVLIGNRRAEELLDVVASEHRSQFDYLLPASARPDWQAHLRQRFSERENGAGHPVFATELLSRSDGMQRMEIATAILDQPEGPVALCTLREVTHRARPEETVRHSESRWQSVLDALPAGVAALDEEGRLVYANSAAREIWGGASYVGVDQFNLYRGWWPQNGVPVGPTEWGGARAVLHGEASHDQLIEIESFDGSRKVIRTSAVPLHGQEGRPVGAAVLIEDVTRQRRDEEALREAERRYRTLSEAIPHLVWSCDPTGRVQYLNQQWQQYTGISLEQLNAQGWDKVIHPDDRAALEQVWEQRNQNPQPFEIEYRFRRHDGVYCWFLGRGVPLLDPSGQVSEWIGTSTDISALKETEEALRESETRFRLAMERTPIGMALVGIDGRYLKVNQALCELTGYTEEELVQTDFQSLTHPDDLPRDLYHLQKFLAGQIRTYATEKRYLRRDGSSVWVLLTATLVRDEEGTPLYFLSQIQDITDRKRAEEELRRSEAEYRAIFELAAVGVTESDPETGRFLRVNQRFCEITGYSADELLAMSLLDLAHSEDWEITRHHLREVLENRCNQWSLEKRCVRKDGTTIWVRLDGTLLRGEAGRPYRRLTMVQDVSDRKEAEQALQEAHALQEAILNSADYAIISTDEYGTFRSFNRGAERMFGYSAAEVVGKDRIDRMLDPQELAQWGEARLHTREFTPEERFRAALEVLGTGEALESEWTGVRQDGSQFPMLASMTALRNHEGAVCGMVAIARDITRRKQAEIRLKQQSQLLDLAHDAIVVRDLQGRITYWNTGAERTYGFKREEVIGRKMSELVGMAPEVERKVSVALRLHGAWEGELSQTNRSGARLVVASRHVLQSGQDGVPAAVLEINRDVTWQKQAEEERARQSIRWLLLSEAAGELLETEDPEQVVRSLFERVSTHAEVDSFIYLVAPEDGQALQLCSYAGLEGLEIDRLPPETLWESICGLAAQRRAPQYAPDLQQRSDPGTELLSRLGLRAFCSYPLIAGERLLGTLGFGSRSRSRFEPDELTLFASISHYLAIAMERARLLDSERRQTKFFRTVLHALPVGVWLANEDGRIVLGNPEAYRIWGGGQQIDIQQYFPRKGWWVATGAPIAPDEWASNRAARTGATILNELIRIEAADGTRKTIRNSAIPVRGEDGEAYGVVVLNEDVTEQQRAEAERERLLKSEQQKSIQLELAIREAHHRIKNNLQAITDLLSLELFSARSSEVADPLRVSMERVQAIALVHDLLSRDEDVETVDIRHLGERLIPTVLQSNGISLSQVELRTEVPSLHLPSRQATALALILNELISNAAKHALKGRNGLLEVRVLREDGDVLLVVRDDGPGLPPGFDMDRHGNVGLGVVQALIHSNMGGEIRMYNDAGLRVELRFPLRVEGGGGGARADTDL